MRPLARIDVLTLGECLAPLVATTSGPLSEATTFERHIAGAEANDELGRLLAGGGADTLR